MSVETHLQTPRALGRSWASGVTAMLAGAAVVGLLALLWFGLVQRDRGTVGVGSVPFREAPDFQLGLFDGSQLRLSEALASGKPMVLNFWASWCVPCIEEAPILESAWRRERSRVQFVGVNVQDIEEDARAFLRRFNISYPNGSGNSASISVQYGMRGLPETYFIAPDGRIVRKWNGPMTAAGLDQFIGELQRASNASR